MDVTEVAADLLDEQASLDGVVAELDTDGWGTPTASDRWSVTDQIGHLAYFDRTAALAITDPDRFTAHVGELSDMLSSGGNPSAGDELTLGPFRALTPERRLAEWRDARDELAAAAATLTNDTRVVWYGPSMGAKSFLTARLMEAWAHGIDVRDALGAPHDPTDRLRHVAQLGFITRGWTYINRGGEPPSEPVRVALTAPSGASWEWGPSDAAQTVTGPAADFCLVVTQRRNVADTELDVTGPDAVDWMSKAQAFAGRPTDGPAAS